jgi:hypothetical protein
MELAWTVCCMQGANLFILHCSYFMKELLPNGAIKKPDFLVLGLTRLHCNLCSQVHRYDLGPLYTSKMVDGTLIV